MPRPVFSRLLLSSAPLLALLLLHLLGFRLVIVLTPSMEPSLPPGSLAVAAPAWLVEPEPGSVVVYRLVLGGREFTVVHRVVEVKRVAGATLLVTKGDASPWRDPWLVQLENVTGVVVAHAPLLGYALLVLRLLAPPVAAGAAAYWLARRLVGG